MAQGARLRARRSRGCGRPGSLAQRRYSHRVRTARHVRALRVVHVGDERTTPRRQSPRLPGSRRQSQGSNFQGGEAGEEEEEDGQSETPHSIQPSLRQTSKVEKQEKKKKKTGRARR